MIVNKDRTMKAAKTLVMLGLLAGVAAASGAIGAAEQVLATVAGEEITSAQLKLETGGRALDAAATKSTVNGLIDRKLLAAEATKRGLDKTPLGAMMLRRADEMALVDLFASRLGGAPAAVTDQQIATFVNSHPTMFAQHRLISLNQIMIPNGTPELLKRLQPFDTMAQFEELLARENIRYARSANVLDTLSIDPAAAAKIGALSVGEVFIAPRGDRLLEVSEITANRLSPIGGTAAQQIGRAMLTSRRKTEALGGAVKAIVDAGQSKVKLNKDYAPKPAASGKAKS